MTNSIPEPYVVIQFEYIVFILYALREAALIFRPNDHSGNSAMSEDDE